jgi:hypothetical protein
VRDIAEAPETLYETLACVLKTHEDRAQIDRTVFSRLVAKVA